ncbi:radical SAM protein, partial [Candidatus Bathyarchaeota archaeon]|nr:radical SAM protein [Candidatus Bathyarchaeota archaeon]
MLSFINKIFRKQKIPTGRFTYRGEGKFKGLALQLRVEPDRKGLLIINANTVLYLNQTSTAYGYYLMQGFSEEEIIKKITNTYKVKKQQAKLDFEKLIYTISTLAQTEEVEPISYLDITKIEPFTQKYSAPIRMDMALTFRCQNNCVHCYAGGPHKTQELTTNQWKQVIDQLHKIGVFILTFTGGEPTLREDLPELLAYSQNKGLVTGLITNGRKIADKNYTQKLEKTGLDFIQITLESHKPKIHNLITKDQKSWKETTNSIKNLIPTQIYKSTNTTLNQHNAKDFLDTIDYIKKLGVATFGCNSLIYSGKTKNITKDFALSIDDLKNILPKIQDKATKLGLKFLWYTPTQYCEFDPIKMGLGIKSCSAAMINMCVGPNGDVYPCQSYFESLGNILNNKWKTIWNHPLATKI